MDDLISRQAAIDALNEYFARIEKLKRKGLTKGEKAISLDTVGTIATLPATQPERLTDCDFETIRIHLNAYKEKLCNQQRWKEAEEYQQIIDRFMAFASAQPERKKGKWKVWNILDYAQRPTGRRVGECPFCGYLTGEFMRLPESRHELTNFCSNCGADMRGEADE